MKKLILFLLLLSGISCQKMANEEAAANQQPSIAGTPAPTLEKPTTVNGKRIDWSKYEKVYAFVETESRVKQMLGIKWHNADSIDYQLVNINSLCEMEIYGTAKAINSGDTEIDEDEEGAYPVEVFMFEAENYLVSVRIEAGNRSKARFLYVPSGKVDEACDPNNDVVLKLK